jgi:hypothetical protein
MPCARGGEVVGVVKSVLPYSEEVVEVVRSCQISAAALGEEVVVVIVTAATVKSRRSEEVVGVVRSFSILPKNEGIERPALTAPACEVAPRSPRCRPC